MKIDHTAIINTAIGVLLAMVLYAIINKLFLEGLLNKLPKIGSFENLEEE